MSYGALGNGSANDGIAIQACINAAYNFSTNTYNGTVYFPAGTYYTYQPIYAYAGICMEGANFIGQGRFVQPASVIVGDNFGGDILLYYTLRSSVSKTNN